MKSTKMLVGMTFAALAASGVFAKDSADLVKKTAEAFATATGQSALGTSLPQAVASPDSMVPQPAHQQVIVKYRCGPFQSKRGHLMDDAPSPAIVTFPHDASGGKDLYVRAAVFSSPLPKYEKLTKVTQHIEGSQWSSGHYDVSIDFIAGAMRAHIQMKGTTVAANCVSLEILN